MQLAFLNSIHSMRYSVITRVFMHMSTVNYLLCGAGFFRELHTEAMQLQSFPVNNKKSMQLQKFSTANNLHYTVLQWMWHKLVVQFVVYN